MTSRRRGANTGNSSPVVTRAYELRDRTRGKGDVSALTRSGIKNTGKETKDQPVKKNVKNKPTREPSRRDPKPVEPDTDNDSEDVSEDSDNSREGLSENDRQSRFTPTKPLSGSSAKVQPSQPGHFSKYIDDQAKLALLRPRIGSSYDSAKKQQYQARQVMEDTEGGSTKTRPFQYSSEDDEENVRIQDRQKPKDEFTERTRYKEEFRTWRSPDLRAESGIRNRYPPNVNTETRPALSKPLVGFSDGEEEVAPRHQRKEAAFPRPNQMNHNPEKDVKNEQKGNLSRKPLNNFFRCFAACMKYFVLALLAVLALLVVLAVGLVAVYYISPESVHKFTDQFLDGPEVKKDLKVDFEKLTSVFTNQSPQMWKRSRVILERHLENWKGNTEPAILLLTGAKDAEETLLCIGTQLADIYSSSLNGNYTVISGSYWSSGSNAEVKAYIDDHLSTHFQATTRAAVLHRLELLPSGSLLILYKYCDHESAVFKNVMLLFTVLLDDETLAKDIPLNDLEENVRGFLIKKLIDPHGEASHDWMDHDKFSGVWSRISHLVLPVFPEENIPEQCVKKPI